MLTTIMHASRRPAGPLLASGGLHVLGLFLLLTVGTSMVEQHIEHRHTALTFAPAPPREAIPEPLQPEPARASTVPRPEAPVPLRAPAPVELPPPIEIEPEPQRAEAPPTTPAVQIPGPPPERPPPAEPVPALQTGVFAGQTPVKRDLKPAEEVATGLFGETEAAAAPETASSTASVGSFDGAAAAELTSVAYGTTRPSVGQFAKATQAAFKESTNGHPATAGPVFGDASNGSRAGQLPPTTAPAAEAGFGGPSVSSHKAASRTDSEVRASGFKAVVAKSGPGDGLDQKAVPILDTPIKVLAKPRPAYTAEARRLKIEGEVVLEVLFRRNGEIQVMRIIEGLGHGLDENARRAAETMSFRPATRDGRPVDAAAVVRIQFQLAY